MTERDLLVNKPLPVKNLNLETCLFSDLRKSLCPVVHIFYPAKLKYNMAYRDGNSFSVGTILALSF
jgi:hypothetical protein